MKKLFATLALSIFALSIVSCNDNNKNNDNDKIVFSADKTEATTGDKIVFTLTGPIEGINWGLCDWITCNTVTFVDNKYTYTVPANEKDSTFTFDFYALNTVANKKSNYVPIKINAKQLPK